MPLEQLDGLKQLTFNLFEGQGVIQGVFTRAGGVSPDPWSSLNLGGTVGDARANVVENRRRIFNVVGLNVETIYDAWQVHGTQVITVESPRPLDVPHEKGDVILTNRKGITLFMRFADCVPVFLFDPQRGVIGIAHAGWRGTVDRVVAEAIRVMREVYQCKPEDILAGIGPSICVDHYQVGEEVAAAARESFGAEAGKVLREYPDGLHLDLWAANQITLKECGVRKVELAGECTYERTRDWYSHRAEHGKTGRFGALLALE